MAAPGTTEKFLRYRGQIRALYGHGGDLYAVTVHPEGASTSLWRVDVDKAELHSSPLSAGGTALAADAEQLHVAGTDGHIYQAQLGGAAVARTGGALSPAPSALALLSGDRLAAVGGSLVHILAREDGRVLQSLPLPEAGTAVASDSGGNWLAVGTSGGTLAVFDCEGKHEFLGSESAKLHEGSITALLFEPNELRVLSAGVDNRLLSTHVRGKLEPEDRGGKSMHEGPVRGILQGPGQQFYTGASDSSVKAWPWEGKGRPTTIKEGLAKVAALAQVEHKGRPHLAVGCEDGTLRLLQLDAQGKIGQLALIFRDAYAWARHEFEQQDARRREAALREIAGYKDAASVEMLAARAAQDPDHALKVLATELLGGTRLGRAVQPLENLLKAEQEAVRQAALAGLRGIEGAAALRPLELALATKKPDIGVQAVEALAELAKTDELAFARLVKALNEKSLEVRSAALRCLEELYPQESPEADLIGLGSDSEGTRSLALTRLYQRGLLGASGVGVAVRRHMEDPSAEVRLAAFLISLSARPRLATALRSQDAGIQRLLTELEAKGAAVQAAPAEAAAPAKPKRGKAAAKSAAPTETGALEAEDLEPLLQAMACRALDTCLRGATGLALLKDARAFGTLLQLSREKEAAARVEACKALQELGDPRGIARLRLMLRDADAQVRDAAFTALAALQAESPLRAAEAGLQAEHEDARRRGLQLLVQQLKKGPREQAQSATGMLARALNDSFQGVRGEAFKAALSLKIGGTEESALRFALGSLHADVRRDVLVEILAQVTEPWAWKLLLERFGDPEAGLRLEAFEFANKKASGRVLEVLAAAMAGRHTDLKIEAAKVLIKRKDAGARELLVQALDDESGALRMMAVGALLVAEENAALVQALGSRHADVRLRAAVARATEGDAAALEPLLGLATAKEPPTQATPMAREEWVSYAVVALQGLAELGDPRAHGPVAKLLESPEARIRQAAASVLAWVSPPEALDPLRAALQHADEPVRLAAAFGLAVCGDASGASLLLTPKPGARAAAPKKAAEAPRKSGLAAQSQAEQRLREGMASSQPAAVQTEITPDQTLLAAFALLEHSEDPFLAFLDHSNGGVRGRALLLLLLLELGDPAAGPDRLLAALSSAFPRVRLDAARALELLGDAAALESYVVELLNDQGEGKQPWKIEADVVRKLAAVVTHGTPQLKVRAARLLVVLESEKQEAFDRVWRSFSGRFATEIAAVSKKSKATRQTQEGLGQLVFGAYVGLSRQAGGQAEVKIRQTALARLLAAAQADAVLAGPVRQVFLLGLGDANGAVRKQAFEGLGALGLNAAVLAAEALAAGERDIAAAGLKLLTEQSSEKEAIPALEQVLLQRTDGLEEEAAKVLAGKIGWPKTWKLALGSRSETFREQAVAELAKLYEESAEAAEALRGALGSKFRHVRSRAARELGQKKDATAYGMLVELLAADPAPEQRQALAALKSLGDARTPAALLDRLEKDPSGTALRDELLAAIGSFRQTEAVPRLLKLLEEKKLRAKAFDALLAISGFDQKIKDAEDESPERWEEKQHPRHLQVLVSMLETVYRLSEDGLMARLIPAARWARGLGIDAPLAALAGYSKPEVRKPAVEAIGWRLRKRGGPAEPLVRALAHPDPETQLLAAEGLALGKRKEGISVLLASVELMEDLGLRRRAVLALGKLADPRALDLLLRLVNEDGHALQEQAAEAIGYLSASDKAETIFKRLSALAGVGNEVAKQAMKGLRWLGTREAWQRIRELAVEPHNGATRRDAATLLGNNDDPATRELLGRLLQDPLHTIAVEAAKSLRKLAGPDSLEPDYAFLESPHLNRLEGDPLERLHARGDAGRLLELLPKIRTRQSEEIRKQIVAALLARKELPVEEAVKGLASAQEATLEAAAQILGRVGKSVSKKHGATLVKATTRLRQEWTELQARAQHAGEEEEDMKQEQLRARKTTCWQRLLWACGRLETGAEELMAAATVPGDAPEPKAIRAEALAALAGGAGGAAALDLLETAAMGLDAELRPMAAAALQRLAPQRALGLVPRALDDRAVLDRLLAAEPAGAIAALRPAAQNVHSQGVALPHLVAQADVAGLAEALSNRKLSDATRLGAIEALARIATEAAEAPILELARNEAEPEELRKAAWRASRRARRYRQSSVKEKVQR